ncbi:MAG: DEAD/DEAH box helicase [Candidatus Azobacteroides sp.]|nr:DEAD/DEAH box helicase [Candidatus Azobacteroides sp.]
MKKFKLLRIIYQETAGENLIAKTPENATILLRCTASQWKEWNALLPAPQAGNILNLLNVKEIEENSVEAEWIVLEPDYLIDVSTLAECFRPYGNHPLNYSLSRLQAKETTSSILLGNSANFFMDEFVYEDENSPVDYADSLKKLFRTSAFEFTACEDLKNPTTESVFFANCRKHFSHIQHAVQNFFPRAGIDKKKIVLEPSFISNALGLQGRLDILLCNYSAFIELKSGKAAENFRDGGRFMHSAENHYMQMILYLAILEFNLDLNADEVNSYLLYSKYPVLSKERRSRKHLQKALFLRNQIVAWEYALQKVNHPRIASEIIHQISAQNLNVRQLSGTFFDQYLSPSIDRIRNGFGGLTECEKAYFLRLYTFIVKELWLSKAGEREYEGVKKASVLWNMPLEDKLIAGEILYDLKIIDNQAASESHTLSLEIPEYKDFYLPNFRPGDAVVLYERNSKSDTVNNRQVFKGAIEQIESNRMKIRLRYRQKNLSVWHSDSFYAVEHDYMDTVYTGMFKGLTAFIQANPDRRELLTSPLREKIEKEIFLLMGPPGAGKTSVALKQRVETELRKNKTTILLLSYTNRAVDEICKALMDISHSLPFIRIGNELNCAPEFRHTLLEKYLDRCNKRSEVAEVIQKCRIFTGTVASICNKPELFQLKQFDLAIVDEATQLLEPHLVGLFCAKTSSGKNAIRSFVLIGDHKQLPAVTLQSREDSKVDDPLLNAIGLTNLSDSLFERLYRKYNEKDRSQSLDMLSKQGRMHPDISAFPSKYFYEGRLESLGLPHQTENWIDRDRLNFYPVKPFEKEFSDKTNLNEANQVVAICQKLYQEDLDQHKTFQPLDIGIITPYRNQIALIRKQLKETGIAVFSDILVDTVERFQGSQRDIIIYSFCIKTEKQLAALPNMLEENGKFIDRKLNVALTRARKQLHLIGNEELLKKNDLYRQLLEYIEQQTKDKSGTA